MTVPFGFVFPPLLTLLGVLAGKFFGSWAWLSGSTYVPEFDDLKQVTWTATCAQQDSTWSLLSDTCDPNRRAFNYPSIWARTFAFIGLTDPHTAQVGVALTILFITAVGALSYFIRDALRTPWNLAIFSLAALSAPVWLAIDRGSTDIIVFALLTLALYLNLKRTTYLGTLTLGLATFLKLFTVGAGLMILADKARRRGTLLFAFFILVVIALLLRSELPLISVRTPRTSNTSFGVSVVPIRFASIWGDQSGNGRLLGAVAGLLFIMILVVLLLLLRFKTIARIAHEVTSDLARTRRSWMLFLSGGATVLVAYLVGTSYDYRLIFALFIVASLLLARSKKPVVLRALSLCVVALMVLSGQVLPFTDFADVLWLLGAPLLLIMLVRVTLAVRRLDLSESSNTL